MPHLCCLCWSQPGTMHWTLLSAEIEIKLDVSAYLRRCGYNKWIIHTLYSWNETQTSTKTLTKHSPLGFPIGGWHKRRLWSLQINLLRKKILHSCQESAHARAQIVPCECVRILPFNVMLVVVAVGLTSRQRAPRIGKERQFLMVRGFQHC